MKHTIQDQILPHVYTHSKIWSCLHDRMTSLSQLVVPIMFSCVYLSKSYCTMGTSLFSFVPTFRILSVVSSASFTVTMATLVGLPMLTAVDEQERATRCTSLVEKCRNCEGVHSTFSRDCPAWKVEKEVWRVKATEGISYYEARMQVKQTQASPASNVSYTSTI
ncbi:uncharacterized protein LOC123519393 [Portunus trituberculatus]|uniref:uncharacterized protein LOC123519393 n=1 Tax=Portunus trituberculatus TaxID=210409 RepID=UPI001E1CE352|nr:uncharacterized protein LOC123519393 [Portunus trituberculatus]